MHILGEDKGYISLVLDILFALSMIMAKALTVVYVYNHTQ